jgi:dTDP-4-amino-4,6-dideoxygalactose transaminase
VGRPNLPDKERFLAAVGEIWDSRVLSNNGPFVQQLEGEFCRITGAKHAVAVSNATLGLQLVAKAMELQGEIILPSYTFIATAHAFRWEGLRPVFCDVEPHSHTLDPERVQELIGDETCAIAGVHLWGNACSHAELEALAKGNGLRLLYDSAHCLGIEGAVPIGDAAVYSLHATKIVSAFEGGVAVTDSDVMAHRLRSLRNFGFAGYDDVRGLGTNAKMSEISAAMALCGLGELQGIVDKNRRNYECYGAALSDLPGIEVLPPSCLKASNYQYAVVRVDEARSGLSRDALVQALWAEGVRARRYFFPGCHRSEPYRWESPDSCGPLPVTDRLCQEIMVLPTGSSIEPEHIEMIRSIVRTCLDASRRIAELDFAQAA